MSEAKDVSVFHPEMFDEIQKDGNKYFQTHEATKAYREGFPDISSDDKEVYLYIKNVIFNTLEALWSHVEANKDSINIDDTEDDIHDYFRTLIKLHFVEDDFLNHLELSLILWFYGKKEKEDATRLQSVLDDKLIPKTDYKKNKLKVSPVLKCLAASLAYFIEQKGISARQAILTSSDFFNLSHSLINKILPDVREAQKSDIIDMMLPVRDLIKAIIILELNDRVTYIENIVAEYQAPKVNKSRAKHFNESYEAFEIFVKETNQYFSELLNAKEFELLEKNKSSFFKEEHAETLKTLFIEETDNLSNLLSKTYILSIGWLITVLSPEPLEDLLQSK
ncbi:MAG: hypothetical protein QGH69_05270 [Alphaproteobacteria bacterium]|jgi:hypothetical protein|nr:hypothetical protein [Alphaproteobacteria bacterium]